MSLPMTNIEAHAIVDKMALALLREGRKEPLSQSDFIEAAGGNSVKLKAIEVYWAGRDLPIMVTPDDRAEKAAKKQAMLNVGRHLPGQIKVND